MKLFEEQKVDKKEITKPVVDSGEFIKANLMKSVNRSDSVRDAVRLWLTTFEGGMTRKAFDQQMKRLDWDDEIAISQLAKAKGKRVVPLPPPPKKPKLDKPLLEAMLEETFVAVHGRKFKPAIKDVVKQLRECGKTYVLQIEELILQFKDYEHKGTSPQMIEAAVEADFLVIVDLEMPIHLEWHIHEAISRIGRMREAKQKPIISTWCRFNDCNDFFERFSIYRID
nr:MAG TPA: hypothetical protein [Caudoviricetes sp.]